MSIHRTAYVVFAMLLYGCAPSLPEGVVCDEQVVVADDAQLAAALKNASPKSCIVLRAGDYAGPVVIDESVTLVGETGGTVRLRGAGEHIAVVLMRGQNCALVNVTVANSARNGVVIEAAGARIDGLQLSEIDWANVGIRCEEAGCFTDDGRIEIAGVNSDGGEIGVWANAGMVSVRDSHISGVSSSSLSGGAGVYVLGGATLELVNSVVAYNQIGVVVDGPVTRAHIENSEISANIERGVWAQRLRGDSTDPALIITGSHTQLRGNGVVGLGVLDSTGIRVEGVAIIDTIMKRVVIDVVTSADIGDGIGLFAGSQNITVSGTTLSGNQRAQGLLDNVGANVSFASDNTVLADAEQYKIVVQNSTQIVTVPTTDLSVAPTLPLSAALLPIPQVAQ